MPDGYLTLPGTFVGQKSRQATTDELLRSMDTRPAPG